MLVFVFQYIIYVCYYFVVEVFKICFKKCCYIIEEGWVCNGDYCFWINYYIYIYIFEYVYVYVYIKENDVCWMDFRIVC